MVPWGDDSGARLTEDPRMSSSEIRARLSQLADELVAAERTGLDRNQIYMAELEGEIVAYRLALVGAAVTEIAVLRGELFGRQFG
jgi:ABC-type phosphate transport system auxiliary subunit